MLIIDFYFETATAIITFIETDRTKNEAFIITPNQLLLGRIQTVRKTIETFVRVPFNLSGCRVNVKTRELL